MADTKKNIETVTSYVPYVGEVFKVTFEFLELVGYFGSPDPLGNAIRSLQADVQKLREDLNRISERVNELSRRVIQLENSNRLQRLATLLGDIDRVQFQIGQQPADANVRSLIAHDAGAIAEVFLTDLDLWRWTDIQITQEYDDYNAPVNAPIVEPMPPDFKAYPALPVYLAAVMTWLTAIDFATSGNYELVQQRYGDRLRRHIAQVSTRPDWNELAQPPTTFPEHIQARITCYPEALHQFARNDECHFAIMCKNVMDRHVTAVENSDFVLPFPTGTLCTADPARGTMDERQIEADRGVEALTQLGQLLNRVERTGTLREQFIGRFDQTPAHNVAFIYAVKADGELMWWKQQPSAQPTALAGWVGPRQAGSGWGGFVAVYPAGGSRFYALRPDGILLWYQHDGFNDGAPQWQPAKQVGHGWNSFAAIFAGGDGVLYALQKPSTGPRPDQGTGGHLLWYKHDGYLDGGDVATWRGPVPIASGWNGFKTIFSSGKGIVYAVGNDGTLFWYRHKGFENGAATWDGPLTVGSGWQNFSHIFSVGEGIIYAIQADGTMLWYKHEAWNVDDSILQGEGPFWVGPDSQDYVRDVSGYVRRWLGPLPAGRGWTGFRSVFPLLPSTTLPVR